MAKKKELKKMLKQNVVLVKNKEEKSTKYTFEVYDFKPVEMYLPKKYYTARMGYMPEVKYLDEGDIIIIDPSITQVKESGIYAFEYKGFILVRQFQIMPFGYKDIKDTLVYKAVASSHEEVYPPDEINIIGAVISKQVEIFHNLYGIRKTA